VVVERDTTVTGEVVSSVLQDTPETWAQLERACAILRENDARVTARTGGHGYANHDQPAVGSTQILVTQPAAFQSSGLKFSNTMSKPLATRRRTIS